MFQSLLLPNTFTQQKRHIKSLQLKDEDKSLDLVNDNCCVLRCFLVLSFPRN